MSTVRETFPPADKNTFKIRKFRKAKTKVSSNVHANGATKLCWALKSCLGACYIRTKVTKCSREEMTLYFHGWTIKSHSPGYEISNSFWVYFVVACEQATSLKSTRRLDCNTFVHYLEACQFFFVFFSHYTMSNLIVSASPHKLNCSLVFTNKDSPNSAKDDIHITSLLLLLMRL